MARAVSTCWTTSKTNTKKIKSAVTDSGRDIVFDPESKAGVSNLLTILATLTSRSPEEVANDFAGKGYGDLKTSVAEAFVESVEPFQRRVNEYLESPEVLDKVLADGAHRAELIAKPTLASVYDKVGFLPGMG